ncbi:hypothetical protein ACFC1R_35700 [Kitasatospora sp. NPDC056138]
MAYGDVSRIRLTGPARAPEVWTLAHQGKTGGDRLRAWAHPTKRAAFA